MTTFNLRLPGASALGIGRNPAASTFADDLANIWRGDTRVLHMIDPKLAVAGATTQDTRDRITKGAKASASIARAPAVLLESGINGKPSFDPSALASSTDMRIFGSKMTGSISVVFVCIRPPTSTTASLFCFELQGTGYPHALRQNSSGNLFYATISNAAAGELNLLLSATLPAVGAIMIVAFTFDLASKTSKIWINGVLKSTKVHTTLATLDPALRACLGGVGGVTASLGWPTLWSRPLVADGDMTLVAADALKWAATLSRYNTEYGLPA